MYHIFSCIHRIIIKGGYTKPLYLKCATFSNISFQDNHCPNCNPVDNVLDRMCSKTKFYICIVFFHFNYVSTTSPREKLPKLKQETGLFTKKTHFFLGNRPLCQKTQKRHIFFLSCEKMVFFLFPFLQNSIFKSSVVAQREKNCRFYSGDLLLILGTTAILG